METPYLINKYSEHTEHIPRQGPSESKRIRTAYTRHQTLELGEFNILY